MRIHHLEEVFVEDRWDLDEVHGAVKNRVAVLKPSELHRVLHDGQIYERGSDGTFEVPDEVGQFFCGRPGWYTGPPPVYPIGSRVEVMGTA